MSPKITFSHVNKLKEYFSFKIDFNFFSGIFKSLSKLKSIFILSLILLYKLDIKILKSNRDIF